MKRVTAFLLLIILAFFNVSVTALAQENDDNVTFYFDCPKGFTTSNTVICSLWRGYDSLKVKGELLDNSLYKFTIPNFSLYDGMSFNNDGILLNKNEVDYEEYYRTTITFFIDKGKIYLDRDYTIEGSPDNLVLTNQVFYQSTNLSYVNQYYAKGEWLTLSKWHRSDLFNKYLEEKGAEFPEILDEEQIFDLWYMYDELYTHINESGELSYSLVFGASPDKTKSNIYEVYGNYILRQDEAYFPDPFGYYIYLSEADRYVTLKEAFELNVPDIEAVFTTYGLGELLGDVDCDKNISVMDATKIQRCLAELDQFNINDEVANNNIESFNDNANINIMYISDFNRDGTRNIFDATAIQCFVAGINN